MERLMVKKSVFMGCRTGMVAVDWNGSDYFWWNRRFVIIPIWDLGIPVGY